MSFSAPGRPVVNETAIATLVRAGVTVGLGPQGTNADAPLSTWAVRNLRFDAGWVSVSTYVAVSQFFIVVFPQALLDNPDVINRAAVLAMASVNVAKLVGVQIDTYNSDLVATAGGDLLSFEGKVVAVISPRRGRVDFFE